MVEFTGERVVPGHVNTDLWSEHVARYAFARTHVQGKRVLDAGCGAGYGSAELAVDADSVVAVDIDPQALTFAAATYPLPNVHYAAASCTALPFLNAAFDVVVAFEVIEHLSGYREFIQEAARVLRPGGLFIVSTPNKRYYAESRAETGPNPYHRHEFDPAEFGHELTQSFAHVTLLLQNRVEAFAFHLPRIFGETPARIDGGRGSAEDAHFLIALCSQAPLGPARPLVYVPHAANVLREREQHIRLLEQERQQTQEWLANLKAERDHVLHLFREQKQELEDRNRWAQQLNQQLEAAHNRIGELQTELTTEQAAAAEVARGYELKVADLEHDNIAKTQWARDTETRLTAELAQQTEALAECTRLLDQAEHTVEERTLWAQRAEAQSARLSAILNGARSSRWVKLGRAAGIGPNIEES